MPIPIIAHNSYRPKELIMDLLRAFAAQTIDIRILIGIGEIFDFNPNQIRVAVTRLTQADLLICPDRGLYQLGPKAQESSHYAREWRLGEDRMRSWDGSWLMLSFPPAMERSKLRRSLQALELLGFRQALRSIYVRPFNLRLGTDQVRQRLLGLGLSPSCELWRSSDLSSSLQKKCQSLWIGENWDIAHQQARLQLHASLKSFPGLSSPQLLRESFILGGRSIRLLVTDPLLPDEFLNTDERRLHTTIFNTYDHIARQHWHDALEEWEAKI